MMESKELEEEVRASDAQERESVNVGEVWIDKDKRMNGRKVKVTAVSHEHGWVRYSPCNENGSWVSSLSYRSRLNRFPKAFRFQSPVGRTK